MTLFMASVLFALGFSALCSLLEACLLSLSPVQIAEISESNPTQGRIWEDFKKNIERPIAVILIINTGAHTIGATFAGSLFEKEVMPQYGWEQTFPPLILIDPFMFICLRVSIDRAGCVAVTI